MSNFIFEHNNNDNNNYTLSVSIKYFNVSAYDKGIWMFSIQFNLQIIYQRMYSNCLIAGILL